MTQTTLTPHLPTQIEHLALDAIIPYARNSRTHSPEQVTQIAASIREFGFTNPVLIDEADTIIAGHGRVLAAQQLGLAQVPCIRLTHLTDAQRRAYVIADNKLAEQAGWDMATLARELEDLAAEEFDLTLIGYGAQELQDLDKHKLPSIADLHALEAGADRAPDPDPTRAQQDFEREMADTSTTGQLPIVPQYAEHHQAFIILSDNTIDEAWLRNRLGLEGVQASYKDVKTQRANIVSVAQLRKAFL